jgi:hypothetical protein
MFKNPFLTSKKTQHVSIKKINWLMLFKLIIAVYSENRTKPINIRNGQNAELLNVKLDGACSYHWVLNG